MAAYILNEKPPTGLLIAQAVGITASTYLFGGNGAIAFIAMPAVMQAPSSLAAKQWRKLYDLAKPVGISCSLVASSCIGYVAYHQNRNSLPFKLNTAAAVIFPLIMPFTAAFLVPINNKLFERADAMDEKSEASVAQADSTKALLDRWTVLHVVRTAITGAGALLAIWAALDR